MKVTTFRNVTDTVPVEHTTLGTLFKQMASDADMLMEGAGLSNLYLSDKEAYDKKKRFSLRAFCIGWFSKREDSCCTDFEPYLCFDLDHVPPGDVVAMLDKIGEWEYNYLSYPSVSGCGLRVIVKTNCTPGNRPSMYNYAAQLLSVYSGVPLDTDLPVSDRSSAMCINMITSNVSRLWFYSGVKIWRFNKECLTLEYPESDDVPINDNPIREVGDAIIAEIIVREAENKGLDMTLGYKAWYDTGMALASLGEDGRGLYHRLSAINGKYKYSETDKKFDNFISTRSGKITMKTLSKAAEGFGILYTKSQYWPSDARKASPNEVLSKPIIANDLRAKLNLHRFVYSEKPKDVDFVLRAYVGGERFDIGGFGMMGLITGLEKSRKTTFLQAITASGISSGKRHINFEMNLIGKRIIYVDTEQPDFFFWNGQRRAHDMAGLNNEAEKYEAYRLRGFSVDERVAAIDLLVDEEENIGLLIIDGVLDLVKNYNNEEQCQAIAQKLMEWTDKSKAMVLAVIHVTKSTGMTTGHLGSMLNKKCDFSFEMKNDTEKQVTTVNSRLSRTKPFKSFDFTQDENGWPVLVDEQHGQLSQNDPYFDHGKQEKIEDDLYIPVSSNGRYVHDDNPFEDDPF